MGQRTVDVPAVSNYLDQLAYAIPESTYWSHKTILTNFQTWCDDQRIQPTCAHEKDGARFIETCSTKWANCGDTLYGNLCTISNYIATVQQDDPELVKYRISTHLNDQIGLEIGWLKRRVRSLIEADRSPNQATRRDVENLLGHLRQRQFGTRTHAFVEVLVDSLSHLGPVHELNVSDLNLEAGTLKIEIPNRFLVSQADLCSERTVQLSEMAVDVVATYLKYERDKCREKGLSPLFTTSRGRASSCTLRRSIRKHSQRSHTYSQRETTRTSDTTIGSNNQGEANIVRPSDVRWYALTKQFN